MCMLVVAAMSSAWTNVDTASGEITLLVLHLDVRVTSAPHAIHPRPVASKEEWLTLSKYRSRKNE